MLTQKELQCIEDLLSTERLAVMKAQMHKEKAKDGALKEYFNAAVIKHQQHYDKLLGFLSYDTNIH